ncbi:MAG: nucleotidyl transferase AbiEii/AbiGii toxin family protein [Sandaracinaceae bacterium]
MDLQRLLLDAIESLAEAGLEHALMGGGARNAYAEPRATKDVDFVVAVDPSRLRTLRDALARRGFSESTRVGGDDPVPDLVLFRDAEGRRIDLLFAHTDFERSALARRNPRELAEHVVVPVVTPEDLIVYKILADRPQDRVDIQDVVRAVEARGGIVDWTYVEGWCDAWEVGERLARVRAGLG